MTKTKQLLEFSADFFNKAVTLVIIIQFFQGQEIGIIQLSIIIIGLLLDLIARLY